MSISEEKRDEIRRLLSAGRVIEAIRSLRAETQWDLIRAKKYVDSFGIEAEPQRRKPAPIDQRALAALSLADNGLLKPLARIQNKIQKILFGLNYAVTLSARAVCVPFDEVPFCEVIKACYPDAVPASEGFLPAETEMLQNEIEGCLCYEGDAGSGPQFTPERLDKLRRELVPAFWAELRRVLPSDRQEVYRCGYFDGLPGYPVFWDYCFLLWSREQHLAVVLCGSSSD
jgi:hypothetical protein